MPKYGRLETTYEYPPIPDRSMDWSAHEDPEGYIGRGPTEIAAVIDYFEHECEELRGELDEADRRISEERNRNVAREEEFCKINAELHNEIERRGKYAVGLTEAARAMLAMIRGSDFDGLSWSEYLGDEGAAVLSALASAVASCPLQNSRSGVDDLKIRRSRAIGTPWDIAPTRHANTGGKGECDICRQMVGAWLRWNCAQVCEACWQASTPERWSWSAAATAAIPAVTTEEAKAIDAVLAVPERIDSDAVDPVAAGKDASAYVPGCNFPWCVCGGKKECMK